MRGALVALVEALEANNGEPVGNITVEGVSQRGHPAKPYLKRLPFALPIRDQLPPLDKYAAP